MSMTATYACARHCYVGAGPCWFCADERDAAKHCVLHVDQPLEHGTCRYCYAESHGEVATPPYHGWLAKPPATGNPKDAIGALKLPMNLVPDSMLVYVTMAFAEGASKYGAFNWRVAPVRASIYMAAHDRHMAKWRNGQRADPKTKVPHLASAMACLAIILDAELCGTLIDDRPPAADLERLITEAEEVSRHVAELNAHHKPHHCTIADAAPGGASTGG